MAIYKTTEHSYRMRLDFNYGDSYGVDDLDTLYCISVDYTG